MALVRTAPVIVGDAGKPAPDAGHTAGHDAGRPPTAAPLVTLLIDSSGSMEWLGGCTCSRPGCTECLPDCNQNQQNRWFDVLAAISGSFQNFSCVEQERTAENGSTYDINYNKPFYRLGPNTRQSADGIIDRYADRVRYGLATFDGVRTYAGASDLVPLSSFSFAISAGPSGEFSYGGASAATGPWVRPDGSIAGKVRYPTTITDYFIDSGIVSTNATDGALILPTSSADPATTNAKIKNALATVRPFAGAPTAAALDDLYYAFDHAAADPAKRYVILLTDGAPDDDFRQYPNPGCNCAAEGDCGPLEDPTQMACPYPAPQDAATNLRCGFEPNTCAGPVTKLIVIGLDITDDNARASLTTIAANGGSTPIFANSAAELTTALNTALDQIIADAGH
jgi:hypothetical protein